MVNPQIRNTRGLRDGVLATSRHVWLAGLGAASMTRGWAEKQASPMFRSLVHEGWMVESRAIRFVGDRVETSVNRASGLWNRARATFGNAVRTYASTAASLVPSLATVTPQPAKASKPGRRAATKSATRSTQRTKRLAKAKAKR